MSHLTHPSSSEAVPAPQEDESRRLLNRPEASARWSPR